MADRFDTVVVGGGIVGLAFAWEAARRGGRVAVFERDRPAQGASVRNFGMVWPIGQPPGEMYRLALRSRERWAELADAGVLWANPCGALHAVYEADEDAVLREFAALAPAAGVACKYLDASATAARFPAVVADGLRGALYSPTEMAVDPREAIAHVPGFLRERHGVELRYGTAVTHVEPGAVRTAAGDVVNANRAFVCSGTDFQTLFPAVFAASGIRRCKLQMLRTGPQPGGWRLGPHLAGGLTLTHYAAFRGCPGLDAVKARVAAEMPEYVRYGIHVMAAQNGRGEVVIGDSHEYDDDIGPFDKDEIDRLILAYLGRMLRLPDPAIAARWHGVYAKHPTKPVVIEEPLPGCVVVAAPGGAGMTLAFGFARDWFDREAA